MPILPTDPPEAEQAAFLRRWSWGAFLLNWIWSIGNNTWIGLLTFVPIGGFVMPFVLGAKGNEWAWRNHSWASFEDFRRVQRNWARAGVLILVAVIALTGLLLGSLYHVVSHSAVYALAKTSIAENPSAKAALGAPITFGWPSIAISDQVGGTGFADISVEATGPKGRGEIVIHAEKAAGIWLIKSMSLHPDGSSDVLDLLRPQRVQLRGHGLTRQVG